MSAIRTMPKAQREELKESLTFIKNCDYKGTAVKVELEAQLGRQTDDNDEVDCSDCDGAGYTYCQGGCGSGFIECPVYHADEPGETDCGNCDNDGQVECPSCFGADRQDCEGCDGEGTREESNSWSDQGCKEYLLNIVPKTAKDSLIFSKFYNDGSVDSEFTFTLPIEKAHMVVYFIEAFEKLAREIGNDFNTRGAGMHIAILTSTDGDYPRNNSFNENYGANFANALVPLLPALYFLASADHNSRSLRYRVPEIALFRKYAAISGENGCFEYRIFETCYKRPLAFIDFMIVIAKTLRYFKETPTNTSLKIGQLGIRDGEGIERFYFTAKHIEALDKGLAILKPDYKSIVELKRERNFKLDHKKLVELDNRRKEEWRKEFTEVKKRRRFERLRIYHNSLAEAYSQLANGADIDLRKYARDSLTAVVKRRNLKGNVRDYINDQQEKYMTSNVERVITV